MGTLARRMERWGPAYASGGLRAPCCGGDRKQLLALEGGTRLFLYSDSIFNIGQGRKAYWVS
jgi:hypothetical protein